MPSVDDAPNNLPMELIARPRRLTRTAIVTATILIVVFVAVGIFLKQSEAGVVFSTADQIGIAGIGFILAGFALLFTRPRVWANEQGIRVRNVFTQHTLPWGVVREVIVPNGSAWAVLDLEDDDQVAVLGLQSGDGQTAVAAMRRLRTLHAASHSPE